MKEHVWEDKTVYFYVQKLSPAPGAEADKQFKAYISFYPNGPSMTRSKCITMTMSGS
jgi:hypothetical protein